MFGRKSPVITEATALPGRSVPVNPNPAPNVVLGTELLAEPRETEEVIYLAAGCFWGVEEIYWELGAKATAVGYMGGFTPNPTYEEVCSGATEHAVVVRVVFDAKTLSLRSVLRTFWECHDPTTLNRQGNDIGTQYRSAIYYTTREQAHLAVVSRDSYEKALEAEGKGQIVTEFRNAESLQFYLAEDYHQQYLKKNPNGYRCHAATGIPCPMPGAGPLGGSSAGGAGGNLIG